jgi:hypothetical protein
MLNEERINGLETQVRTLKRIVCGVGCLLVAGIVVGATSLQSVPDVIQAKKFEVVAGTDNVPVVTIASIVHEFTLSNDEVVSQESGVLQIARTIHPKITPPTLMMMGYNPDADGSGIIQLYDGTMDIPTVAITSVVGAKSKSGIDTCSGAIITYIHERLYPQKKPPSLGVVIAGPGLAMFDDAGEVVQSFPNLEID